MGSVGDKKNAARQHDLYAMSTAPQLLSSRRSHGVLTIHNDRDPPCRRASAGANFAERVSKITVPAGHGKGAPGEEHARSPNQSILNCPCDARIAAANISYRRKTAVEGVTQHLGCIAGDVSQRLRLDVRHPKTRAQNMAMRIDQPRHQSLSGNVDNIPVDRRAGLSVHRDDPVALDDDNRIIEVLIVQAVEYPCVQECRSLHNSPAPSLALTQVFI